MNKKNIICVLIGLWICHINSAQDREISLINPKVIRLSVTDVESLPKETQFSWCNSKMGGTTFLSYDHGVVGFVKSTKIICQTI